MFRDSRQMMRVLSQYRKGQQRAHPAVKKVPRHYQKVRIHLNHVRKGSRRGFAPMDKICNWNIRGLNWSNKQEDAKFFLHEKQIGMVGLLETKVKERNVDLVADELLQGCSWRHNFNHNAKGRIWIAWRPGKYIVNIIAISNQFIHCKATQIRTMKSFFITYVYGANHELQRRDLWEALKHIASGMEEAWCMLGDFNSILYSGDRLGGMEVQDYEVKSFGECIATSELQELQCNGSHFTWTNKIIWSKIDRVFVDNSCFICNFFLYFAYF
ncbi:hypothetical protein Cgig2_022214 [Carnegiea gigantea]|uniref:Endonuclease/exonuclease/phosphatase domain-containing protein n=1 Tax=Carnegiea gigantea TaxID=171969 RepID=A0A9Q1GH41_9CARY|nr:hypothetical protein Cgig2_022214 [Carnegiea gigantea]